MKKALVIIAILLILGLLGFAVYYTCAPDKEPEKPVEPDHDYSKVVQLPPPEPVSPPKEEDDLQDESEPVEEQEPEPEPYISPVDFETLREWNSDIIAWMDIPNTDISYPVFQSPDDDAYYLKHNSEREYSTDGALFSEKTYNADDFSDLITVVYGHHTFNNTMFGNLQNYYSEANAMQDYGLIRVFLPDRELDYEVFATVPYDPVHILYNYGANNLRNKRIFQYDISKVHSIDAHIETERFPTPSDPILILSTCLQGNHDRRYLVLARQIINE